MFKRHGAHSTQWNTDQVSKWQDLSTGRWVTSVINSHETSEKWKCKRSAEEVYFCQYGPKQGDDVCHSRSVCYFVLKKRKEKRGRMSECGGVALFSLLIPLMRSLAIAQSLPGTCCRSAQTRGASLLSCADDCKNAWTLTWSGCVRPNYLRLNMYNDGHKLIWLWHGAFVLDQKRKIVSRLGIRY